MCLVKDGVKEHDGCGNVVKNTDLLQLTQSAYAQYKTRLDDVKKAEEIAKQQKVPCARKAKEEEERSHCNSKMT